MFGQLVDENPQTPAVGGLQTPSRRKSRPCPSPTSTLSTAVSSIYTNGSQGSPFPLLTPTSSSSPFVSTQNVSGYYSYASAVSEIKEDSLFSNRNIFEPDINDNDDDYNILSCLAPPNRETTYHGFRGVATKFPHEAMQLSSLAWTTSKYQLYPKCNAYHDKQSREIGMSSNDPTTNTTMSASSKKKLMKTEYCKFILNNEPCKFGNTCHFAHSESELQYKTLYERHDAGLLDKETMRTRPCFDFVATGSCPFGQRCDSIHDPRTKAIDPNNQFWLPHCVLETKKLLTDVHIDWCKKLSFVEIHYGHTFGLFKGKLQQEQKNIIEMCFDDFYSSVIESTKSASNDANEIFPTMKKALTEAQRNEIALKMSYITADSDFSSNFENTRNGTTALYKYKPSHVIFNELCMLLQSRAFDISAAFDTVNEIDIKSYNISNPNHVLVHDVAFGLPGSSNCGLVGSDGNDRYQNDTNNKRPRSLFFHILPDDIYTCTFQERMNYKKTCQKLEKVRKQVQEGTVKGNEFIEKPIVISLPKDEDCFDLTTDVLKHRLSVLKGTKNSHEELLQIEKRFNAIKQHLTIFGFWPINDGRENIDEMTLVPEANDTYSVPEGNENCSCELKFYEKVWKSFTDCAQDAFIAEINNKDADSVMEENRLQIFKNLSLSDIEGEFINLPHIKNDYENILTNCEKNLFAKDRDWEKVHCFYTNDRK